MSDRFLPLPPPAVPVAREAVTLPLLLLTVAALGGVRVGPSGALALVPPSLMALLLATLLLAALVRSGAVAPGRLVNDRRAAIENTSGAVVLVADDVELAAEYFGTALQAMGEVISSETFVTSAAEYPALPEEELSTDRLDQPPAAPEGLLLASAPTLWSGPAVEHSPSLSFLAGDRPTALISVEDGRRLGIDSRDEVELEANGESVRAIAVIRTGVPPGSVFLTPAALAGGPVQIRAREAVTT